MPSPRPLSHVLTDDHHHMVDGTRWPGVTEVIGSLDLQGSMPADFYLDRGTAVHLATELLDLGTLDESTVDPEHVLPRLNAYRKFLEDVEPTIVTIEELVKNERWKFCGRIDRVLRIRGRLGVLDIKCGAPEKWHRLQTMGYRLCCRKRMARWALYLKADETYRLIEHDNPSDEGAFLGVLAVHNWL